MANMNAKRNLRTVAEVEALLDQREVEIGAPAILSVCEAARILLCSPELIRYYGERRVPLFIVAGRRALCREQILEIARLRAAVIPGWPKGKKRVLKTNVVVPAEPAPTIALIAEQNDVR